MDPWLDGLFPCLRRRVAPRRPVPVCVHAEAQTSPPEASPAVRSEALLRFLGTWGNVDERAVRAWLATPPSATMPPIPESPGRPAG